MKLSDLKLGQDVTIYKYYFNMANDIKVDVLDYYVHNVRKEIHSVFDKKDSTLNKEYYHYGVTLYANKNYEYDPRMIEMREEDGNEFHSTYSELFTEMFSLNNTEETLNKFKALRIDRLLKLSMPVGGAKDK